MVNFNSRSTLFSLCVVRRVSIYVNNLAFARLLCGWISFFVCHEIRKRLRAQGIKKKEWNEAARQVKDLMRKADDFE